MIPETVHIHPPHLLPELLLLVTPGNTFLTYRLGIFLYFCGRLYSSVATHLAYLLYCLICLTARCT